MAASDTTQGSTSAATSSESGDLGQDLARLRDDFGRLSDTVAGLLRGGAGSGAGHMREAAVSAREAFDEATGSIARAGSGMVDDASHRLRTLGEELDGTFQRSPMMGVVAAAGLGMLLGMLARR